MLERKTVAYYRLFRFTNWLDKLIILMMIVSSICIGVAYPMNILIFKNFINIIVKPQLGLKYVDLTKDIIIEFGILATSVFIAGFVQIVCVSLTASRSSRRFKSNLFSALLRQDISWFDQEQTGQLITKMTDDIESIEVAISDKLAQFVQQITLLLSSLIVAFFSGWKLTFVGCTSIPIMCVVFFFSIHFMKKYSVAQVRAYSIAGGICEEILSAVRTVVAFNAQDNEVKRYSSNLTKAEKLGLKKAICQGFGMSCVGLTVWSVGSLVFYLGFEFVRVDNLQPGVVIQVFVTIVLGSISFGTALPIIENFMAAKAAAYPIFQIIDRIPTIDYKKEGIIPESFCEDITFLNVNFEYPTRPGVTILKNFNFTLQFGKTVAFIGPSGSGKSTIIHLLQRLYDPLSGEITLNKTNLKEIDLNWYRSHIGVVQQEPPLFSGTIRENIQLGKLNSTDEEIRKSSKDSNAFEFIMESNENFDTLLGDRGAAFSGGQKQRIAIATALVRDPHLLLLDEATSALDSKSEHLVQSTIDKTISEGKRTVVIVAHRLQTVRNADQIVVMKNGTIVEQGNHDELIQIKGAYFEMLKSQKIEEVEDEEFITVAKIENEELVKRRSSILNYISSTEIQKSKKFQLFKDFIRLIVINGEKFYLIIGFIASVIAGIIFPFGSLIYSQMFQVLSYIYTDPAKMISEGHLFCGLLLIPGCMIFVIQAVKIISLGKAGEVLVRKLRALMMTSILKQEMAWFDEPENLPGILTARLATEASLVKAAAGIQLSVYIEATSNIISSFIIGFYFSWQLALLFFIFVPLITLMGIIQGRFASGQRMKSSSVILTSSFVMEVLNNIRAVNSMGLQNYFSDKYYQQLKFNQRPLQTLIYGFVYGLATSAQYFACCVVFYVGSVLIDQKEISMIQLMRVFSCFNMSAAALGRALSLIPDADKAREAARKSLMTIDRETKIDANSGLIPKEKLTGNIEFKNIFFRYPTRMNVSVLRALNLKINSGQSVALVGRSGCGKSTLIQLLERYYDPIESKRCGFGQIFLDGYDLKNLNLSWVRNQIGIVKQEPTLFNMTISENVAYGSKLSIDMDKVINVCKLANIHDFIESLPEKYNTNVGQRGGHLSGGQKQRICIARALYKEPVILLLDEATSALDSESEAIVQEALEKAQSYSTNLIIAHRLTTIKNCDKIAVIDDGVVVESGMHHELMDMKGQYYEFNLENIH